jgi:hypothetical protein
MSDSSNENSTDNSSATVANACRLALKHATLAWPTRERRSDGTVSDKAHLGRKSDHNDGNAFDLTHDPKNGVDCNVLSELIIDDPRVTYVIWNKRIYNRENREWRAYKGTNPHTKHMHVSIRAEARDDTGSWPWSPNFADWLAMRSRQSPPPQNPKLRGKEKLGW